VVELGPKGEQHYDPGYAFDVKTALAAYPAIGNSKPELIRYLENGQCPPVFWKVGKEYQPINVQADPANRTLKFFDGKGKPVTAEQLNQNAARQRPMVKRLACPYKKRER
jgi:hypothetical protein